MQPAPERPRTTSKGPAAHHAARKNFRSYLPHVPNPRDHSGPPKILEPPLWSVKMAQMPTTSSQTVLRGVIWKGEKSFLVGQGTNKTS